tara:strand:- start:7358 stop:8758 length:1401 start_codon:yes stop_codon:yes gene_type:complete
MKYILLIFLFISVSFYAIAQKETKTIKIYKENPRYWEFNNKPLLLLGASNDDNPFQWPVQMLIPHLDSIKSIGANYMRNTMSNRVVKGVESFPYQEMSNGKFDLSKWNDAYWEKVIFFLEETEKRDIIVQIEIWDRFDFSRQEWLYSPYNPQNNINYSFKDSGFETNYPKHPGANLQPFFFTTPRQNNNELLLDIQKSYVNKLLSITLNYGHILYCIDNETSGAEEWSTFWARYIKDKAGTKKVLVTEMWDDHDITSEQHKRTIDNEDLYDYVDISQNAWNLGYSNWERAKIVSSYVNNKKERPLNSVKIYGNDKSVSLVKKGITSRHAKETFFRNIMVGLASSRFHRPNSGLGLGKESINIIKSIRMAETKVDFWDLKPMMSYLKDSQPNECYLIGKNGMAYVLYFPREGSVKLNLKEDKDSRFNVYQINISNADWENSHLVRGGKIVKVRSKKQDGLIVIFVKN